MGRNTRRVYCSFTYQKNRKKAVWVSNIYSRQIVHRWRSEEHAILIGTNTALEDNPSLNTRLWKGNSPIRVVLDSTLKIPKTFTIYNNSVKTIIITDKSLLQHPQNFNLTVFESINFSENIVEQIIKILHKHNIQSVIIEGGAKTIQTFIDTNLWDEARVFKTPVFFKSGIKAPKLPLLPKATKTIKQDLLEYYFNTT